MPNEEGLSLEQIREWDAMVSMDEKYGKEEQIIKDVLKRYPKNDDIVSVAMKVSVIDLTNSTQLSKYKSRISLFDLAETIVGIDNLDRMIKLGDCSAVKTIAERTTEKYGINIFSFASKYCHYHNVYIYGRDDFSIFDSVVSEHLYEFNLPVNNPIKKGTPERWRVERDYESFNKHIGMILDHFGIGENVPDRRRCFDHYLWFKNR